MATELSRFLMLMFLLFDSLGCSSGTPMNGQVVWVGVSGETDVGGAQMDRTCADSIVSLLSTFIAIAESTTTPTKRNVPIGTG